MSIGSNKREAEIPCLVLGGKCNKISARVEGLGEETSAEVAGQNWTG